MPGKVRQDRVADTAAARYDKELKSMPIRWGIQVRRAPNYVVATVVYRENDFNKPDAETQRMPKFVFTNDELARIILDKHELTDMLAKEGVIWHLPDDTREYDTYYLVNALRNVATARDIRRGRILKKTKDRFRATKGKKRYDTILSYFESLRPELERVALYEAIIQLIDGLKSPKDLRSIAS